MAGAIFEFGPYRLELTTRRLLRDGEPVALTPKAFDVLAALIERRDRVVDKAELMKLVWPDSFVEEANLSQTIFVLRKTCCPLPDLLLHLWARLLQRNRAGQGLCAPVANEKPLHFRSTRRLE